MVILNMNLEVFGKMVDALTEERNLHFGRACVRLMNPELLDDCLLLRFSNSHILRSFSLFPSLVASISTIAPRDCKGARPLPIVRCAAFSVSLYGQLW